MLFLAVLPVHKWQIHGQRLYKITVTHGHTQKTHKHIQYNHTGKKHNMSWVVKYEISGLKERKEENKNGERGGEIREKF